MALNCLQTRSLLLVQIFKFLIVFIYLLFISPCNGHYSHEIISPRYVSKDDQIAIIIRGCIEDFTRDYVILSVVYWLTIHLLHLCSLYSYLWSYMVQKRPQPRSYNWLHQGLLALGLCKHRRHCSPCTSRSHNARGVAVMALAGSSR